MRPLRGCGCGSWRRPDVALVTLNRPERLNALSLDMVDAIGRTFLELGASDACRVVVLTGPGRGFCAGMDIVLTVVLFCASIAGVPEDAVARHVHVICTRLAPLLAGAC